MEKIQTNIIKTLIRTKMFDKYRYNVFFIVIDGTGHYSNKVNFGEQAITKIYNKDFENEYTLYSYFALKVKLICGNMTFSLAAEFVENDTYNDIYGNVLIIELNITKNEVSNLIKKILTSSITNLLLNRSIQLRLP